MTCCVAVPTRRVSRCQLPAAQPYLGQLDHREVAFAQRLLEIVETNETGRCGHGLCFLAKIELKYANSAIQMAPMHSVVVFGYLCANQPSVL